MLMNIVRVNIEHSDMLQQHYKKDIDTISYDRFEREMPHYGRMVCMPKKHIVKK
jgi:hypothetical protein